MSVPTIQTGALSASIPVNPGNVIPLSTTANQTLTITPIVDGSPLTLELELNYNEMANYWVMSISNGQGNLLLTSIPLITGSYPAANILGQYGYLEIGSAYIINASNTPLTDYPNNYSLGTDFVLIWGDTAP
jgi:hypothetical protein